MDIHPTEFPWDADIVLQEQFGAALGKLISDYQQRGLHDLSVITELGNMTAAFQAGVECKENIRNG